ncbi:Arginase-2, mitochondrial [Echinococcus granulosus]|nr:Arginase-2, mitochondrial [Echinococcus granulosus]
MGNGFQNRVSSLGIVGAAVDKGQPKDGVQNGPKAIRENGLIGLLKKLIDRLNQILKAYVLLTLYYSMLDAKVNDYGEITQPKDSEPDVILNCENQRALVKTTLELTECVSKSVSENDMTLILGGDHSIGIGSIAGHLKTFPNSFVVWVDAHADINTPGSSESRHTHGMPLSFLLTQTSKLIPQTQGFENIKPVLEANQLLYIGLRDVDLPELKFIKELNIPYFDMHDVKRLGIQNVMEITLKTIMRYCPNCHIHLSFDIDGLDPKYAPSTGTPVPGGLSLEEGNTFPLLLKYKFDSVICYLEQVYLDPSGSAEVRKAMAECANHEKSQHDLRYALFCGNG